MDVLTDGISTSPEIGFGVAIVSSRLAPGRRRATAAHELGHHVAGDAYASGGSASTPQGEREKWIEAFAAELLLPRDVAAAELAGGSRQELIRLAVEYRVSWSLAIRAGAWVQACVLAEEQDFITHLRVLEMARGALGS